MKMKEKKDKEAIAKERQAKAEEKKQQQKQKRKLKQMEKKQQVCMVVRIDILVKLKNIFNIESICRILRYLPFCIDFFFWPLRAL